VAGDETGTERLHEYWVHGEGALKIRWGAPGDFDRCVRHLGKYIADPEGYCNLAHHAALGIYPATHAAMEKKATGRSAVTAIRAEMTSASINDLPDSAFAYIEPGGTKDSSGRTVPRSLRHFPVHDAAHARDALSRAPQSPFGDKAMPKIKEAAKKFGIDVSDDSGSRFAPYRPELIRYYPVEDMRIVTRGEGDGSGRVVEAFAAVFDQAAEIQDFEGHYLETIAPSAFNKRLADLQRARDGFKSIKVLYNHGMTIQGTPSERFSMPVGTPVAIEATGRGLLTRTEYNKTPLAEEILELVRSGSVTSQSFTGRIVRSDPALGRGRQHRARDGQLTTVRRMELGLREYGPVLWPAYSGAEILGVRMSTPGAVWEPDGDDTTPDDVAVAEAPPADSEHAYRHTLFAARLQLEREKRGIRRSKDREVAGDS
jgi:HK97 family phage prohead protease